jgi:hypothetical protein
MLQQLAARQIGRHIGSRSSAGVSGIDMASFLPQPTATTRRRRAGISPAGFCVAPNGGLDAGHWGHYRERLGGRPID